MAVQDSRPLTVRGCEAEEYERVEEGPGDTGGDDVRQRVEHRRLHELHVCGFTSPVARTPLGDRKGRKPVRFLWTACGRRHLPDGCSMGNRVRWPPQAFDGDQPGGEQRNASRGELAVETAVPDVPAV